MKTIFVFLAAFFIAETSIAQVSQPLWVRTGLTGGSTSLNFMPDGKHFLSTAFKDDRILVWNGSTGAYERAIAIPNGAFYLYDVALPSTGDTFAVGDDSAIYFIDLASGNVFDSIGHLPESPNLLQFSPTGDTIVWVGGISYGPTTIWRYRRSTHSLIDTFSFEAPLENSFTTLRSGSEVAISGDCKTLAYVYDYVLDTTAVVDLADTFTKLFYTPGVQSVALNGNGSQLAVSNFPSKIIDASNGQVLFTWAISSGPGLNMSYLHSSDTLMWSSDSGIMLHIPGSMNDTLIKVVRISTGGPGWASSYEDLLWAISPDCTTLLSGGDELDLAGAPVAGVISLYRKPELIEEQVTGSCGEITQTRWSPIADTITASDIGGGIRSYDAASGSISAEYGPQGQRIGGFDYFADANSIAYSSFDDDDEECFECDGVLAGGSEIISNLSMDGTYYQGLMLSPSGKQLVLGNIFVDSFGSWNFTAPPSVQYGIAFDFSPDGTSLLIGDSSNLARMSTSNFSTTNLSDLNTSGILGASFAPNGNEIAVIQEDKSVEVLSYPSCAEIYHLQGHNATVTGAIFSKNSRYLITSSIDSTMRVWDLATGKSIFAYSYSTPLYTAGFSYDQKYVAASDDGTSVIVWNAPSNLKVEEQPTASQAMQIQNSPNPVTDETAITYSVPYSEEVAINLYDVLGNETAQIGNGVVAPGEHTISIGASMIGKLAPGIYYYRIEAASGVASGKMVIE